MLRLVCKRLTILQACLFSFESHKHPNALPQATSTSGGLDLVSTRLSAAARLLKFAALGAHVGLCAGVRHTRRLAKVLDSLASVLSSTQ